MLIPRPLFVIIEPFFDPDQSPGGIWIPETAKGRCDQGIVKYVGSDCRWIKVGMYVLFSGYTGETIDVEGEGTMITMHEKLIIAEIISPDMQRLEISGVYHLDRERKPFIATLESIIPLIRRRVQSWTSITPMKRLEAMEHKGDMTVDEMFELPYCKEATKDD